MYKQLRNEKGFTIIEIMIVLAIAALILLIVLLAVPALQRNAKSTTLKNDAGTVSAAVTEFESNNNGSLPTAGGSSQAAQGDAATIGGAATQTSSSATVAGSTYVTFIGNTATATNVNNAVDAGNTIYVVIGEACGTISAGSVTTIGATDASKVSIYYGLDTSTGWKVSDQCIQS